MRIFFTALAFCLLLPLTGQAAQVVKVRAGIHDRYNRLVFDWHAKTPFKISQSGNEVTIQFLKEGQADFRSVNAVSPPLIHNLQQASNAQGLSVSFEVPDKSKIESFRTDEGSLAFDVLHMDKDKPKFSDAPSSISPQAGTPAEPEAKTEKVEDKPANTEKKPEPATAAQPVTNKPHLQTLADRLSENPQQQAQTPNADAPAAAVQPPPEPIKGTVIRLSPDQLTRLAVFMRGGRLWIVLDKALDNLTPDIQGENVEALSKDARRVSLPNASAFTFPAPAPGTNFTVRRQVNQWQVWLNGDKPYLPDNIAVNVTQDGQKPAVSIFAGENAGIIPLKDIQVGDRLWVVPMRTPEGRIAEQHSTQDYQILPSFMGVAIVPLTDNVKAVAKGDKIIISANENKNLVISDEDDRKRGVQEPGFVPLFNLTIDDLPEEPFAKQRQKLEKKMVDTKPSEEKALVALDLTRLNISHGFGPEALGMLRIAKDLSPDIEKTRDYQALHGMASAISGDLEQTKADLGNDGIQSQPAAKLWLGYALANHYIWEDAKDAFSESGNVANSMPDDLKPRLYLAQAETALMSNDLAATDKLLHKIDRKKRKLSPSDQAAYEYIEANAALKAKDIEDSIPIFEKLRDSTDRLYKVKAQMALTNQELADKKIDLNEAIKRYERLRFDWRDDRLEIDILRQLGQFYIDNKQYTEGLDIWRSAAGLSKVPADTDAITTSMQKVFSRLYVEGEADNISPLQSVALFERFRELTPPGDAGNVAMMHLAERLAAVDLLDQADSLLEKQLLQNATGEDAAKIGAKLATWRLLDHNPSGALKALDESANDTHLPDALSQKRLLLRARGLADMQRTDEAMALLNTVQSPESYSLKADIAWRQNRWGDTVDALQPLINLYRDAGKTAADGPIPPLVLKMAIAMTLDDNRKGIDLLKAQYSDYMAKTPQAQAFRLITTPSGNGALADLDTLKSQVGQVELFQKFLKDFGS